jgi:hypothetical protein
VRMVLQSLGVALSTTRNERQTVALEHLVGRSKHVC